MAEKIRTTNARKNHSNADNGPRHSDKTNNVYSMPPCSAPKASGHSLADLKG